MSLQLEFTCAGCGTPVDGELDHALHIHWTGCSGTSLDDSVPLSQLFGKFVDYVYGGNQPL